MAILVNGLSRYHSDFSIAIVDSVVEAIKVSLEQNNFRHNQKRIALVRFLGELYNYRMVDSPLIFSTLDSLISVGHGKSFITRFDFGCLGFKMRNTYFNALLLLSF